MSGMKINVKTTISGTSLFFVGPDDKEISSEEKNLL